MKDCSEAPHIRSSPMDPPRVRALLRRREGARVQPRERVVWVKDLCEAEVANQDRGVRHLGAELDAAEPEVAVVDLLRVAVSQRGRHLRGVHRDRLLHEPELALVQAIHPIAQVPAIARVRDDVIVVRIIQHVSDTAYVGVGQLPQLLEPGEHISSALHPSLWYYFAGLQRIALALSEHLCSAKGPLAQLILEGIPPLQRRTSDRHGSSRAPGRCTPTAGPTT
mmetsp:Transcript_9642/g.27140  ORF Transcript_9642/g.27140 Transcript_9642/m.27140 type:complete len:223 (+) Transcript_9642:1216-1884(+)